MRRPPSPPLEGPFGRVAGSRAECGTRQGRRRGGAFAGRSAGPRRRAIARTGRRASRSGSRSARPATSPSAACGTSRSSGGAQTPPPLAGLGRLQQPRRQLHAVVATRARRSSPAPRPAGCPGRPTGAHQPSRGTDSPVTRTTGIAGSSGPEASTALDRPSRCGPSGRPRSPWRRPASPAVAGRGRRPRRREQRGAGRAAGGADLVERAASAGRPGGASATSSPTGSHGFRMAARQDDHDGQPDAEGRDPPALSRHAFRDRAVGGLHRTCIGAVAAALRSPRGRPCGRSRLRGGRRPDPPGPPGRSGGRSRGRRSSGPGARSARRAGSSCPAP